MLDRDRPEAAAKRGASLITRLGAVSRAGSRPPRLAQMRRHHASSALESRPSGESRLQPRHLIRTEQFTNAPAASQRNRYVLLRKRFIYLFHGAFRDYVAELAISFKLHLVEELIAGWLVREVPVSSFVAHQLESQSIEQRCRQVDQGTFRFIGIFNFCDCKGIFRNLGAKWIRYFYRGHKRPEATLFVKLNLHREIGPD